ncbi:MAG: 16S rRNA (cytosine(1402)-N(4))-methyltransferase RsmH [Firmicutes bacterium]|nr:16S rRNA (cytosine(1402)-N(4))-methyltransferase RsmH [Bacillota bacterium]
MKHYSVLKEELIDSLNIKEDGIYVDATIGYAGDAKEILKRIKRGFLFAFDADKDAVKYSFEELSKIGDNFLIFNTNFVNMEEELKNKNVLEVDGIIFDLGFSSPQIDEAERGFSFMKDGVLDMRLGDTGISALEIINEYDEEKLKKIFFEYGEEKLSGVIARKIIEKRKFKKIERTLELVEIIKEAVGANYFYKFHPERKIFQAIRIEVNDELKVLENVLPQAIRLIKKGGRLSVITFHSLEDRIVKKIFQKYSEVDELVKGLPDIPEEYKPLIKIINKKPIIASEKELLENSRSRSAKLRIVERV